MRMRIIDFNPFNRFFLFTQLKKKLFKTIKLPHSLLMPLSEVFQIGSIQDEAFKQNTIVFSG